MTPNVALQQSAAFRIARPRSYLVRLPAEFKRYTAAHTFVGKTPVNRDELRNADFERDVVAQFAFISDETPRIIASSYDSHVFGNAVVELAGSVIRLRVTRDRGQLLVDLSPVDRRDWFDEDIVLHFVGADADAVALEAGERDALAPSAGAINRHFGRITLAFQQATWPDVRRILEELQNRRAEQLFGR